MKKIIFFVLVIFLNVNLFGCSNGVKEVQNAKAGTGNDGLQQVSKSYENEVVNLVKDFGSKLQLVSLQAPKEEVKKSMQKNYGGYVTLTLLEKWISNPLNAPGRLTSSPWPDRIEIQSFEKLSEYEYRVKGDIIEVTSVEKKNGGIASKRSVVIGVIKTDKRWVIDDVVLEPYKEGNSVVYENTQYGFKFNLPESWQGYSTVTNKWEGLSLENSQEGKVVETGPIILIRHPQWSQEKPRQDIPIMIFTISQWNLLQQEKFHIGAAPIGPSELSRNSKYVFALPARYNYAFPAGYEEVENILKNKPLQPISD